MAHRKDSLRRFDLQCCQEVDTSTEVDTELMTPVTRIVLGLGTEQDRRWLDALKTNARPEDWQRIQAELALYDQLCGEVGTPRERVHVRRTGEPLPGYSPGMREVLEGSSRI